MTFFALGRMVPGRESNATVSSNSYSQPTQKIAKNAKEATGVALKKIPSYLNPMFRK
jgi:hypothetical protein